MNPKFFPLPKAEHETVVFQKDELHWFYDILHFHTAFQVTHFIKGNGTCFAGDRVYSFEPGDIFVIGSQMPHVFRSDFRYYSTTKKECVSNSLFFNSPLFTEGLLNLPESKELETVLGYMQSGLKLRSQKVAAQISSFEYKKGFQRIISLLELLLEIGNLPEKDRLTEHVQPQALKEITYERINRVIEHVMTHYPEKIKLEEVASLVSMTPNAFCKYFKQRTRQTFVDFLNQVRINQAARLLRQTELSVNEIAFRCGFNNLSNFSRQFSRRMGHSPGSYRSDWILKQTT